MVHETSNSLLPRQPRNPSNPSVTGDASQAVRQSLFLGDQHDRIVTDRRLMVLDRKLVAIEIQILPIAAWHRDVRGLSPNRRSVPNHFRLNVPWLGEIAAPD